MSTVKDVATFSAKAREEWPETFAALATDQEYVLCPRCDGDGQVYAYFDPEDLTEAEYINCPCCGAMKEASREKAIDWMERQEERHGW